ncbi:MAG: hypothetical protein NW224_12580 [Leptolyngbyaceae cyanobacterium bins.302]|nr:hypothetical protein [Leptolyngbyaceae cyanobacterium bins.302]
MISSYNPCGNGVVDRPVNRAIYIATGGGITQQVSQTLGLKDSMVDIYNRNAAKHHMIADIQGVWVSDHLKELFPTALIGSDLTTKCPSTMVIHRTGKSS